MSFNVTKSVRKRERKPIPVPCPELGPKVVIHMNQLLPKEHDKIAKRCVGPTGKANPKKLQAAMLTAVIHDWDGINETVKDDKTGEDVEVPMECNLENKIFLDDNVQVFRNFWLEFSQTPETYESDTEKAGGQGN